jgi:PAS domain S-box-containing protein
MTISRGLRAVKRDPREDRYAYDQEQAWGEAFEHLAVAVAQLSLAGKLQTANERFCEVLGHPRRDLLQKNLSDFFQPEGSWSECTGWLDRLVAGLIPNYSTNMSSVRADGQTIWVNMVFSLVRDRETNLPLSLTVVVTDMTALKQATQELHDAEVMRDELSRRMMTAQEAERTRIARELHDDIGQSLAVLKIQMLRAGQPVSSHPDMVHASLKELTVNVERIIGKVSHLSHGLHSSELDLLGLTVTVKSCCRECSEQFRLPIECSCDEVEEKLDGMVALAFLRVLQEGLHNAAKHSRAKRITVRLTHANNELGLKICDDGVGFDVENAKLAAGLGLISMRERIHLIGGRFEIWSNPGEGTKITVRAPFQAGN